MRKRRVDRHRCMAFGEDEPVPHFGRRHGRIDIENVPIGHRKNIDAGQAGRQVRRPGLVTHSDNLATQFGGLSLQEGNIRPACRAFCCADRIHGLWMYFAGSVGNSF